MARRPRITEAAVAKLGAERLASLLVAEAGKHTAVKQALQLALEANQGTDSLAAGITQRLTSIGRSQTRLSTRKGREMLAELTQLRTSIMNDIASSDPAEALALMWQLIDLHPSLIERTRDKAGRLLTFFTEAVPDLTDLATRAAPDSEQLAGKVAAAYLDDRYGIYGGLISEMARPLGGKGLAILKEQFSALQAELQKSNRRAVGRNASLLQDGQRAIADATNDVDGFIATFFPEEMRHPMIAAHIAIRLANNERADEAITILDHAPADDEDDPRIRMNWMTIRSKVLEKLGRTEELKALHYEAFETFLSHDHLRAYLKLLPDFDDFEAEEAALDWVSAHPVYLAALMFLVHWPALPRAARLVIERPEELDGTEHELLLPAAEALDGKHPLAGILIRRALVDVGLKLGRAHRFKQLLQHVQELQALDAVVDDYEGHDDHQAFMERVWLDHPHKSAFWDLLDQS